MFTALVDFIIIGTFEQEGSKGVGGGGHFKMFAESQV